MQDGENNQSSSSSNDEAEQEEEQEAEEEEQGEDEEDDDFNFGRESNGNQHLQLPPVDSEDRDENNDDFVDHEDHMMVQENQPEIVIQTSQTIVREDIVTVLPAKIQEQISSSHVSSRRSSQLG